VHSDELGLLRGHLTNLRALLVLSILMTESADDEQIFRLKGHSGADGGAYRPAGEVAWWAEREPLLRARAALVKAGTPEAALDDIDARARAELSALAQQVLAQPAPDPATAWTDVDVPGGGRRAGRRRDRGRGH